MDKFFKPQIEKNIMKKIIQPLISLYPGAVFPFVEYEEWKEKKDEEKLDKEPQTDASSEVKEEVKKGKKKKKKKKR